MPELPEVETTRRGIQPLLAGRVVTGFRVRNPRLRIPVSDDIEASIVGQTVRDVRRRAKYLLIDFDAGCLLVHLGMSGSLRWVEAQAVVEAHDHIDLVLDSGVLRYRDPRRFGLFAWQPGPGDAHSLLARLGPEPLSDAFDGATLYRATRTTRVPVKQALMDAHRVVGVGNIYASESLFRARINPHTPACDLGLRRYARLVQAVRETLVEAIAAGGSSLRDFVGGDGRPGYFQQQYFVYGRDGESCRVCATTVQKAIIGQRASFWCPRCQRG